MLDNSIDAAAPDLIQAPPRRRRRKDWRLGGTSVRKWREWLLAGALISLGIAIVVGALISWLWDSPWAAIVATVLLWVGMLVPVVWALAASRPRGLLRFRPIDLLYGVALGGLLRLAQGWFEIAAGGAGALPSYSSIDGRLTVQTILIEGLGGIVIAPALEELFFRGLILVTIYTVLRRPFGTATAAIAAIAVSTGLFVLVHGFTVSLAGDQVLAILLLGLVCGLLVVLTGRIWGAVLLHAIFNATFFLLALVGTFWT